MKCNICDKDLNDKEVVFNKDIGTFDPCGECLEIALDAAFSDGFSRPDDDDKMVIIEDNDTYESAMNVIYSLFSRKEEEE